MLSSFVILNWKRQFTQSDPISYCATRWVPGCTRRLSGAHDSRSWSVCRSEISSMYVSGFALMPQPNARDKEYCPVFVWDSNMWFSRKRERTWRDGPPHHHTIIAPQRHNAVFRKIHFLVKARRLYEAVLIAAVGLSFINRQFLFIWMKFSLNNK